ncbi:PLP-dependent aminotransferase family protein [Longimicrobium sp.]|uniref:aminotransferase-like domain-containing protein n=1 Tax=Longimicrobium sp. TaxID=2029185 RepID=UPI002B6A8FEC|nr:PLP-dependent aminotransferase family protein [Longimicrobium sp.]HSU17722.1 PLP-dependent aminotransferase family protein [Longimicrobium sp.]
MIQVAQAEERFAYQALAGELVRMIEAGTLRPGDRVPSVRRMSTQHGVSVTTVLQAYRLLEDRRVIRARPQSGFYVQPRERSRVAEPGRTAPPCVACDVSVSDTIAAFLAAVGDPALVPLGAALPHPDFLPVARLARLLGAAARRERRHPASYAPAGTPELRREIAKLAMDAGCAASAADVVITCGCSEAISLCLRAVAKPGDAIAVESPTYFGTLQAIEALGMRALEIPTEPRDGICVDALEEALRSGAAKACVLTPSFQNPLGARMPDEHRRRVAELLARYGVPAIEDDTFGDLHFGEARPRALQAWDREGWVLRCGTFSKTLAPGFRVGWAFPGRFRAAVERLKAATTLTTASAPQLALAELLSAGGYAHHLRRLRRTLAANVERLGFEAAERLPAGTRVSRPQGGFVLWVELPEGTDAMELHRRAAGRGISLAPGPVFTPSAGYRNCIRLSAGHPWSDRTAQALDVIRELAADCVAP